MEQVETGMSYQLHLASLSSSSSPPYGWTPSGAEPSSGAKISPAILLVIIILAVLFFISGILHLLVRFLIRYPSSASSQLNPPPEITDSYALQRQLQQLFDLHDSGLDQTFIDALPVFHFKELMGLKDQFDCAVCLCEFSENDELRLLPVCGHAFHINCIDTWLQSNSTCPLCRATLFASPDNPIFDFDDPRVGCGDPGTGESRVSARRTTEAEEMNGRKGILSVRLGKFRKIHDEVDSSGGETSSSNMDARRCYSMGSYQYVLARENLRIPSGRNSNGMGGHGDSDSDCEDREGRNSIFASRGDSLSVSKIWLWSGKNRYHSSLDTHQEGTFPGIHVELPWVDRTEGV